MTLRDFFEKINMIPKIIHYCWMSGDPYPAKIQRCIESWKRVLPDYEFLLWDAKRFDIGNVVWVNEAFEAKNMLFVPIIYDCSLCIIMVEYILILTLRF